MSGAVAQRYAAALADVALEEKIADDCEERPGGVHRRFLFVRRICAIFSKAPRLREQAKQKAIEKIAAKMGLCAAVRNFVRLIVRHRRTEMLARFRRRSTRN